MNDIPLVRKALLVDQLAVKLDASLGKDVRVLKAEHGVDVQEMIRSFLRREIPKIKKKLESA